MRIDQRQSRYGLTSDGLYSDYKRSSFILLGNIDGSSIAWKHKAS